MSLPSDAFFQLVGTRWKLAKAICIRESAGNATAVGDNGDAQGMFQLHAAFATDYVVPTKDVILVLLRGEPFASINIMRSFIGLCGTSMPDKDVIGTFHDGHNGWAERGDKDGYVAEVLSILRGL
jgi:hypothetical protein